MEERFIYDVEVTDENIQDALHTELFRLMEKYGPHVKKYLAGIAVGPNAFKALQEWGRKRATFSYRDMEIQGVPIVCAPLPFVVPLFKEGGWHFAHEEAKRFMRTENEPEIN